MEALETGADGHLRKPYSAKELIASVEAHLRLAALRRQEEEERLAVIKRTLAMEKMEQVGRLAAGAAHDFNNLLTAVNGYAEPALGMTRDAGLQLSEIKEAGNSGCMAPRERERRPVVDPEGHSAPPPGNRTKATPWRTETWDWAQQNPRQNFPNLKVRFPVQPDMSQSESRKRESPASHR